MGNGMWLCGLIRLPSDNRYAGESVRRWSETTPFCEALHLVVAWMYPGAKASVVFSLETRRAETYLDAANHPHFSPDGKWMAYEFRGIWVQAFPAVQTAKEQRWQVGNGIQPYWRGDGKELYYATHTRPAQIMAVDVEPRDGILRLGNPHALFSVALEGDGKRNDFVSTRDGKKFLVLVAQERKPESAHLSVIYNWPAAVEKR
jgi:hypothetical protein